MNIKNDTRGYIVVETILAFIPFTMAMLAIVMLINVVSAQSRVHYALTQTANELSVLSYLNHDSGRRPRTQATLQSAMSMLNSFSNIFPLLDSMNEADINRYFNFETYALSDGHLHSVFERYLGGNGQMPAHHGFDFSQSFINGDTLVLIVVYDVDFMFAGPLTPFLRLTVTQQAATRLWRRGGGHNLSHFRSDLK